MKSQYDGLRMSPNRDARFFDMSLRPSPLKTPSLTMSRAWAEYASAMAPSRSRMKLTFSVAADSIASKSMRLNDGGMSRP